MLRAGDVISKTELTERLYDQDFERDSNVIEVFIGRLRRKLDPDETSASRSKPCADAATASPSLATAATRHRGGLVSRPSLRRRLMLSVFVVLVVFFGLTVFLLDMSVPPRRRAWPARSYSTRRWSR